VSHHDDDLGVTPRELDDRAADRLLGGRGVEEEPALTAFIAELAASITAAAPAPSPALAAMLEHGVPVEPVAAVPPRPRAVSWRYALVSLAAGLATVVGAGAANALPAPAQRAVADVVGWLTPLDLPQPGADQDQPAVTPTSTPSPARSAEPATTARPVPVTSPSPEPSEGPGHDGTDVRETPSAHDGDSTSSDDGDATATPRATADDSSATPSPDSSWGDSGSGSGSGDSGSSSSSSSDSSSLGLDGGDPQT
jgi:hypothetical protein